MTEYVFQKALDFNCGFKLEKERVGEGFQHFPITVLIMRMQCLQLHQKLESTRKHVSTRNFEHPPSSFQPGQFMFAVNNRSSYSSYSHSVSTWNNSEYIVANLHFLLNMLHGKYNPASIKILKNPATFKITFPNKKRKLQLFVHCKINFQPIFIFLPQFHSDLLPSL